MCVYIYVILVVMLTYSWVKLCSIHGGFFIFNNFSFNQASNTIDVLRNCAQNYCDHLIIDL